MFNYLGIDPGLSGAVAVVDDNGRFLDIMDIPTMVKGKGTGVVKRCVNPRELQNMICGFIAEYGEFTAYLENVNAMPAFINGKPVQGGSSTFSLGDTFGSIRSVLACEGIETNLISPQSWKKHFKISSDKELARSLAIRMYPSAAQYLSRKADHNRAEALLIARYAYNISRGGL